MTVFCWPAYSRVIRGSIRVRSGLGEGEALGGHNAPGDQQVALGPLTLVCVAGPSVTLRRYCLTMYRVILIRVVLMTVAVIAVGVAAYWIASVALEWL